MIKQNEHMMHTINAILLCRHLGCHTWNILRLARVCHALVWLDGRSAAGRRCARYWIRRRGSRLTRTQDWCTHSRTADHRGSLPAEGHREASRAVIFRRPRDASRRPPGGDAPVPGVFSGQPKYGTHSCGWTEGRPREGAAPAVGSGGEGVD